MIVPGFISGSLPILFLLSDFMGNLLGSYVKSLEPWDDLNQCFLNFLYQTTIDNVFILTMDPIVEILITSVSH